MATNYFKKVPSEKDIEAMEYQQISFEAYLLWEKAGKPQGGGASDVFWNIAKKNIEESKRVHEYEPSGYSNRDGNVDYLGNLIEDNSRFTGSRADTW